MAVAGFYRRVLPSPPAIEFASPQGKRLFSEALGEGTMEGFFKLISYYQTQSEPAYCGLTTLAVVLNALGIDPGRKWKGPWRWFDDSMLDCCEPLAKIRAEGITFGKVACLACCNGARVVAFRTNESSIDDFRKYIISCTSSEDCHVIASYHRGVLKQTGSGHFSPIGGYHSASDMVLILDVARFKYPPHWVPLALLWDAMNTVDDSTGQPRGYMIISRLARGPSILYTVSCRDAGWNDIAKYLTEEVPLILKSENVQDISQILSAVLKSSPPNIMDFIKWVAEVRRPENGSVVLSEEEKGRLAIKEDILKQVRETELHNSISEWLLSGGSLPCTAANVCSQGMQTSVENMGNGMCCNKTNLSILKVDREKKPVASVVSGTVTANGTEQGIDMLVPLSKTKTGHDNTKDCDECSCNGTSPSTVDVLTILLLSLPQHTWSGIKEEELLREINGLVSTDNLPTLLQDEVLYLREQLLYLTMDLGVSPCHDSSASGVVGL